MENEMLNLHQVMVDAAIENQGDDGTQLPVKSLRCDDQIWEAANELCKRHGTTVGGFVRQTLKQLIAEYEQ